MKGEKDDNLCIVLLIQRVSHGGDCWPYLDMAYIRIDVKYKTKQGGMMNKSIIEQVRKLSIKTVKVWLYLFGFAETCVKTLPDDEARSIFIEEIIFRDMK